MADTKYIFSLAEADDAVALEGALADTTGTVRNAAGESIFAFCVFRGRTKCVEALARRDGFGPHDAALAGDAARASTLLDAAPWAIDLLSPDGWTMLHLAAFYGRDEIVAMLLGRGADARIMARAFEQNLAIHAAAAGRRIGRTAFAGLVAATGDPDAPQKQGYTALMIAAANGFGEAVDVLLGAGADRSRRQGDGKNAADLARERGHTELAARLE